jgi:hypothetical protein
MEETTSIEVSVREPAEFEKQNKNSSCDKFILKYVEFCVSVWWFYLFR